MFSITAAFGSVILAEGSVDTMAQGFKVHEAGGGQSTLVLVVVCLAALALAVVIHMVVRRRLKAAAFEPRVLFSELCRAHKLNVRQRALIRSIAKSKGLADPCSLFLNPKLWLVEPGAAPSLCGPRKARQLRAMQKRLFETQDAAADVVA